ncbi:MAG: hypothetical protein IJ649_04490 [Oscillospiraceae bacterium]|nr:hypothetical protein [Oscillospiraceae bacterium]
MTITLIALAYYAVGAAYMTLAIWLSIRRGEEPDMDLVWADMLLWPLGVVLIFVRVLPTLLAQWLAAWMVERRKE